MSSYYCWQYCEHNEMRVSARQISEIGGPLLAIDTIFASFAQNSLLLPSSHFDSLQAVKQSRKAGLFFEHLSEYAGASQQTDNSLSSLLRR